MASYGSCHDALVALSKRFLARTRIQDVVSCIEELPESSLDDEAFQENLLRRTVNHEVCEKFPPSLSYRKAFLKALISAMESRGVEVSGCLYSSYTDLISSCSVDDEEEFGFVTYLMDDDDSSTITLKEWKAIVSNGTTGLTTWEGAKCLSEWCLANRDLLADRRVLELGCGVGLAGLTVCKLCRPTSYVFTDCHRKVLDAVAENVTTNDLPESVEVDVVWLDWEEFAERDNLGLGPAVDVVLGADLVYDACAVRPLVKTVKKLVEGGAVAYLASTVRNARTYGTFLKELDGTSLRTRFLSTPEPKVFVYDSSSDVRLIEVATPS